jgi:multisubunit Na+/H+ antiporter MnhE subunit
VRILIAIGLFVLWLALSASFNVAHVVVGAVVACVVTWLNPLRKARVRKVSWPA